jgi:H+-transporting ATPase
MSKEIITTERAKIMDIDELYSQLSSNEGGLSEEEATKRLEVYGSNEIPEKKANPIIKFLHNFWGPIPWMIEIAIALSAITTRWEDFYIILVLLVFNAIVRFWEEHKADNAIELLKQHLAPKARILRDGKWKQGPSKMLVPGDIIRLRLGDIIPADVKLINGDYLEVDQSALTGESLSVDKYVKDIGYSGSIIRKGEMEGFVYGTGLNTYFGRTTELVEKARTVSHFQKAVVKIGNYLIVMAAILVTLIFIVEILRYANILNTLRFALVLIVASIPVALPAVLSVTMAIGAIALAKKEAIVSKLPAIEELAGVDVLCSDKTGTITKNEISLEKIKPFAQYQEDDVLLIGALASREEDKDPIDDAIIIKIKENKPLYENVKKFTIEKFTPFDPVVKRTEAIIKDQDGKEFKVSKGAPQVILELAINRQDLNIEIKKLIDDYANKGYRSLGIARTEKGGDRWYYMGLLALFDPPRDDSAATIKTAEEMGLNVKMVTGDHVSIAKEIAQSMNMGTNIQPVSAFIDKPDDEAAKIVEEADGFAQVFPEHKFKIVQLLQGKDHIVGMTGDGVNDAPALKQADVGIAVSSATDAAKSAASISLTKAGLSVIIDAIIQSRKIFQRMLNYSVYRISETIRVLIFMTLSIIIFQFYPITALMIVLLALLNDGPIMTIALDNVTYSKKPEKWNMRVVLMISTILGMIGVVASFSLFFIAKVIFLLPDVQIQSLIFLKLSIAASLTIYVVRSKRHFWSIRPAKELFLATTFTQVTATLFAVYGILLPHLGWALAGFVWLYAVVWFVITDFIKFYLYKYLRKKGITF